MKTKHKTIVIVGILIVTISVMIAFSDNQGLKADFIIQLPDVENGETGKGFTCTGLTYHENENVFYVGNIGKSSPETAGFQPTIVKLSDDFSEVIEEIPLSKIFPSMKDIQGLAIDYSDNSIWFCSTGENMIRHISESGEDAGGGIC